MITKRVFLLTAVAFREAQAVKCIQCVESRDHAGNPVSGTNDQGCFDAENLSKYELECPPGQNYCGSEIVIDWFPRGWQHVTVRRDCRVDPVGDGCYSSTLTGFAYKDCVATCEGDNCNDNNDEIFGKAAAKEEDGSYRDINCFACNSDYDDKEGVDGNPYCYSTPPDQPVGAKCPIYANSGCFNSKSIHAKEGNETDVGHFFKGCSTFPVKEDKEENEAECVNAEYNGDKILMCDALCSGEADKPCNGGVVGGAGRMCYTCEASINQEGKSVGIGDLACFDRPQNYHLELCADEDDICINEFRVDWQLQGEQIYTMRRLCGSSKRQAPETKDDCLQIGNRNLQSKQCYERCESDNVAGCNSGNEIWNKFSVGKVSTCRVCSDHIYGSNNKEDCAADESTNKACPVYADAACFSSRLVEDTNTAEESSTYHGCSSFRTGKDQLECNTVTVEDANSNIASVKEACKKSCTKDECNKDALKVNTKTHFCSVCTVTVNHFNRTVGEGDIACWGEDAHHKFTQECPNETPFCVTDIEVDWMPKGDQLTTLKRSCAAELEEPSCRSGTISTWQYKDCSSTCDDNALHPCNTAMYETAELFHPDHHSREHHCFNCESHHYPSKGQCPKNMTSPEAEKFTHSCPIYAYEGCFTAITRMTDYASKYPDDVIRGCSTFDQEYACSGWTERYYDESNDSVVKNLEWTSCKESCRGPHCNDQPATIPEDNRCFVCSAQRDSSGNRVGLGNQNCFNDEISDIDYPQMVFDCGRDEYCLTELEVDWIGKGDQIQHIRRRCAKEEKVDVCETAVSDSFVAKDCSSTCEGAMCNNNIDAVARLYEPKDGGVTECHVCQFDEISGGKVDSQNCKSGPPTAETIKECPRWARNSCFTADVVLPQDDGELVHIFRGCSSFDEQIFGLEQRCSTLTVNVLVEDQYEKREASACKQICADSGSCNNESYPDYTPPDNECPPCEDPTEEPELPTEQPPSGASAETLLSIGLLALVANL